MTNIEMIYSEAGGVTKSTTAVSLSVLAARRGIPTLLVDLDPRAASTKWAGVTPGEPWQTISAIIADEEPTGWADDLALPCPWSDDLRILPSDRNLAVQERNQEDNSEQRLSIALEGIPEELVIIDCPNRQGGMLTQNALGASDGVIYAATASQDGIDGVVGARESVARFIKSRQRIGATATIRETGVVVGGVADIIRTKVAKASLADLEATGLMIPPAIPQRTVVDQARMTGTWYGDYDKGAPVVAAYDSVLDQVLMKAGMRAR
ncbi:ParA family protein [Corynebacterium variabile]|uniref:ParA family protein n=1 Tax=Corynebacterium variabile TaxID=1727 RepID=UPI003BB15B77